MNQELAGVSLGDSHGYFGRAATPMDICLVYFIAGWVHLTYVWSTVFANYLVVLFFKIVCRPVCVCKCVGTVLLSITVIKCFAHFSTRFVIIYLFLVPRRLVEHL